MDEDHLELIVKCTPTANAQTVRAWLERRGLSVMPMKSGLLLCGSRREIEKSLGVPVDVGDRSTTVPVPPDLKNDVAAILLPRPRSWQ
jgi:hypothetical protein